MTIDTPLISILTPAYNHGKFMAECIASVQAQTWKNWEMIVVDDGSTDDTCQVVERFMEEDPRIRLIRQENKGIFRLSENYNLALARAAGDYIAILEGDDYWVEDKLRLQMEHMLAGDAVVCWGRTFSISDDKKTVYGIFPDQSSEREFRYYDNRPAGALLNVFLYRNCIPALTLLIRKEPLISIGGFKQPYHLPLVDLPTLCELSMTGEFVYLGQPLGYWRIYPTQVTKTYTAEMTEGFRKLALEYLAKVETTGILVPSVTRESLRNHYNKQLIVSYSRSGRYKLIRGQFAAARRDYLKSLFRFGFGEPVWKLRSLTGLIFSIFHADVEGLTRMLGRKTYKL